MPPVLTRLVQVAGICPLPSRDWRTSREYAPCPHAIGARRYLALEAVAARMKEKLRDMELQRDAVLEEVGGICPLPACDWCTSREYAPCPHAIGARRGNVPSPLARLAGGCCVPKVTNMLSSRQSISNSLYY
eukprot:354945-Prorocentrum_minimum.AAC.1